MPLSTNPAAATRTRWRLCISPETDSSLREYLGEEGMEKWGFVAL